jgi:hypothetical protein
MAGVPESTDSRAPTGPKLLAAGVGRAWNGALALVIIAAVVTQFVLAIRGGGPLLIEDADPPQAPERILQFFSYFTIQSNILLGLIAVTLVANPARDGRVWRVLRLDSVLGITVTGVIYMAVLRGEVELEGVRAATNAGLHYVAPVAGILGWLLFGPRGRIGRHTLRWALVWPLAWIGYTLILGAIIDWYPYPFVNVIENGYGRVFVNLAVVVVLGLGLLGLFQLLDRRLPATSYAGTAAP